MCKPVNSTAEEGDSMSSSICVMCAGGGKTDLLRKPRPQCFSKTPAVCGHFVCAFAEACVSSVPATCPLPVTMDDDGFAARVSPPYVPPVNKTSSTNGSACTAQPSCIKRGEMLEYVPSFFERRMKLFWSFG